ncbi:hypothetical protein WJX73_007461 [Symbiochloris irregularis]|uniref:Protein kinase domain-containing protein n=1 Tax=Symbiochloris irregularis TaxID=706552 RepID=A0AAW1PIY9_9CHLO
MPCFGNGRTKDPHSCEDHRPTCRGPAPQGRLPGPRPAPYVPAQHPRPDQPQRQSLQRFTYGELHAATYGFSERRVVGEGGFGYVYWGRLRSGVHVAVKRLDRRGQQGDREFNVEVDMLTRLHHPNLITLLGVCVEDDHRAAVFQLMHGGCLRGALDAGMATEPVTSTAHFLPRHPLCWTARLNAAVGAAAGLAFLHEEARPSILHRDVKSTNILLDEADCACIGDLGLARSAAVAPHRHGSHAETLNGTFGYLAPEYMLNGQHSHKSDVYAFGVVLLELLTGQQPVDPMRRSAPSLVQHMLPHLCSIDRAQAHLDPVICREPISVPQLVIFLDITAACLLERPQNRPTMTTAAQPQHVTYTAAS